MTSARQTIKTALTMQDVAGMYGFKPDRGGFIRCPFHGDKSASLKIYPSNRGWHCFGCGAGSDVFDFVQRLFSLSFPEAVDRLNTDFHLGLDAEKPEPEQVARMKAEREARERDRRLFEAEYDKRSLEHRRLWTAFKGDLPVMQDGEICWPDEWCEAAHKLPVLEYWFDMHPLGR